MQSEVLEAEKKSINNSVINDVDAGVSAAQNENIVCNKDELQNFIENDEDLENNYSDSDDNFSSPSNSGDEWYAYRGRLGINFVENNDEPNYQLQMENNQLNNNNHVAPPPIQNPQDEEETDFLEMDFEPDTSEIENDNDARYNYEPRNGQENHPPATAASHDFNFNSSSRQNDHEINSNSSRNTGTKPKQLNRNLKSPKQNSTQHITDGDNVFKITGHLHKQQLDTQLSDENVYNIGASCSRYSLNSDRPYHRSTQLENHLMKLHKSPSKSSSHNNKQQRLHEEQNDQFLFEIEPIKPRNSVTIYTSNCDEKILMDALVSYDHYCDLTFSVIISHLFFQTSLKLKPDREAILNYFNRSIAPADTGLIDYIVYSSKKNCNYLKLIELIEESCRNDSHDEYGTKRFDINFYPVSFIFDPQSPLVPKHSGAFQLDFFSTQPEMIDVEVSEIIKRWTPQTDLTPLINIKNKYFIQTNVLGNVNILTASNNWN